MKISEMTVKDRFDDIVDLVITMRQMMDEDEQETYCEQCDIIIRRLSNLRDDIEKKE